MINCINTFQGYYMYIETSFPRRPGDNAKIQRGGLRFTGNTCIRFFYHMYGSSIGTLNVFLDKINVLQRKGDQGNMWKEANIKVSQVGTHSVSIYLSDYNFSAKRAENDSQP